VPDPNSKVLGHLERFGTAAENTVLVLLLAAMIALSVGQIVLRELFDTGLLWADELVKLLVLWIAMLGSVAASRDDKHLRIDVLSHLLSEKMISMTRLVVEIFAAVVCAVVTWHAFRWLQIEYEDQDTVLIDFPAWFAHAVLPIAFILMTYRFSLSSLKRVMQLMMSRDQSGQQ
jgi:TRAP-type C4-dicarboxylate transport system permease small subunit